MNNDLIATEKYNHMLKKYMDGLRDDTLTVEERLNLLEFYVNDHNTMVREKQGEMDQGSDILKYITWAWAFYVLVNNRSDED